MRTSGKNLARRTIAPRLSELITEVYELLEKALPNTKNFAVLVSGDEEEINTRILPLTSKEMNEICEVSNDEIGYIAHTDKEHNFIGGEECN